MITSAPGTTSTSYVLVPDNLTCSTLWSSVHGGYYPLVNLFDNDTSTVALLYRTTDPWINVGFSNYYLVERVTFINRLDQCSSE